MEITNKTLLLNAVVRNDYKSIELLLRDGSDFLDLIPTNSNSLLHLAAINNSKEVASILC